MACLDTCPKCGGYKACLKFACDDCSGVSAKRSYDARASNLAACLKAAGIEELRTRYIEARLSANWIVYG